MSMFAASANMISRVSPILAMICVLLAAGGVHAAKTVVRPIITVTIAGMGNPIVSKVEDALSGTTTLVAILLPSLAAVLMFVVVFRWWPVRQRRHTASA